MLTECPEIIGEGRYWVWQFGYQTIRMKDIQMADFMFEVAEGAPEGKVAFFLRKNRWGVPFDDSPVFKKLKEHYPSIEYVEAGPASGWDWICFSEKDFVLLKLFYAG